MQAFAGTNLFVSLCSAYVSDLVSMHNRAAAIGLVMASFAVGFLVGPAIGGAISTISAALLATCGTFAALFLLVSFVQESLSDTAKQGVRTLLTSLASTGFSPPASSRSSDSLFCSPHSLSRGQ